MKIVYCINGTFNSGGMERILMLKANYFAERLNYDVTIITTMQFGRKSFFDLGIDYNFKENSNYFLQILYKWNLKKTHHKALELLLHKIKPDICVSMFDYDFGFLYKIKDGSKKVLELHFCKKQKIIGAGNFILKFIQKIRVATWIYTIKRYDRFVVLTHEDCLDWGNLSNMCVIPNFLNNIPNNSADLNDKIALSVGRMSFQKGFDILVSVWNIVVKSHPDWNLKIYGNGDQSELKKLVNHFNIEKYVSIFPATSNISKVYLNSSLYIMTSRYEGLPMVLLEAMSYGLPIVSFSCPCGPKDIIKNSYGTLVQNGNIYSMAEAVNYWIENEEKRKIAGKKAREASFSFLQDNVMNMWTELFKSLIKKQ